MSPATDTKRSKYNVGPREGRTLDGIVFDSVKEMRRYAQLVLLEKAGAISNLELQPIYIVHPAFTRRNGKKVKAIVYRADFRYWENGIEVVEDVKGVRTEVYKNKIKLFWAKYPEIDFREVTEV